MLQSMPDFPDLAALNAWLEQRCLELWRQTPHGKKPGTIADVWAEERAALMPLPVAFDGFIELSKRVSAMIQKGGRSCRRLSTTLTRHGIFPPSATRVLPKEGTDNEANNLNRRADHRDLAGA